MSKQLIMLFLLIETMTGCGYTAPSSPSAAPGTRAPSPTPAASAGSTPGTATFAQVNSQILQPLCVSCHNSTERAPDLTSYASFASNTRYVTPGDPGASLLYSMVASGQMPQQGSPLSQEQLQLLSDWITVGAKND